MAENLRAGLRSEGRRANKIRAWRGFGVGLGILFLLLAWRAWRKGGHETALAASALASIIAALAHPAIFRSPYEAWIPAARFLARANAWIVCAILYYVVLAPYAILARMLGARFLATEMKAKDSYWKIKPPSDPAESTRRTC